MSPKSKLSIIENVLGDILSWGTFWGSWMPQNVYEGSTQYLDQILKSYHIETLDYYINVDEYTNRGRLQQLRTYVETFTCPTTI